MRRALLLLALLTVAAGVGLLGFKQTQASQDDVPILRFHRVTPDTYGTLREPPWLFDLQLKYLKWRGYRAVSLEDAARYLETGRRPRGFPERPIAITFDDGYMDNYRYAAPIIKKYGFRATIFVVTGDVGAVNQWDVQAGRERLGMMDWHKIRALSRQGVDIGSHTVTHPYLTSVDRATAVWEVRESKRVLERRLGRPVKAFAYPYGDANEEVERLVKAAGYEAAVSVHGGRAAARHDPYDLHRIRIPGGDGIDGWCAFLWFVWHF